MAPISTNIKEKPVTFLPGRLRLSMKPAPMGSATASMMIGIFVVARAAAIAPGTRQGFHQPSAEPHDWEATLSPVL